MNRSHIVRIAAVALVALALWTRNAWIIAAVVLSVLTILGLGVKIPQMALFGRYVCRGATTGRRVALTFDDGPDARSTPALLQVLRDANVQAAFFCVGERVAAHPDLAAGIVKDGHLLENHSYSHRYATNLFSVKRLRADLSQTQTAIQQITGVSPRLFRPPMGLSNPRVFHVAQELGLTVVGWTARGWDTKFTDPKRIVARIVRKLKPGAIILLHDGNIPAERLVTTVKTLLDTLRSLGYEVVRLDKVLQ